MTMLKIHIFVTMYMTSKEISLDEKKTTVGLCLVMVKNGLNLGG